MQKVAYIFIVFSFVSCSVFKARNSDVKLLSEKDSYTVNVIDETRKLNISDQNFFVRKAEVQVISGDDKQNFLASVKFLFPDKYLISLRSKSGVEGARVFITGDTVLINDRISRQLLFGDPDFMRMKFGISSSALPLLFGDFIFSKFQDMDSIKCDDGFIRNTGSFLGSKYRFTLDCKMFKMNSCVQMNDREEEKVVINYSRYLEIGDRIVPGKIILNYNNIQVSILIKNIEIPWEGEIEFIPGTKYEVIPLK